METCAKCGQQVVAVHSIALDSVRRFWKLCCLCTVELIAELDGKVRTDGRA